MHVGLHLQTQLEDLPTICTSSPLALRIVSRALAKGDITMAVLTAAGTASSIDRCVYKF